MDQITELLGDDAAYLLDHRCTTIAKERLHLPGPDSVDRIFSPSDRNIPRAAESPAAHGPRAPGRHGLRQHLACRSGHRALGRGQLCAQPGTTSIPRTSCSSRSTEGATPSPRPTACWAWWPASTPTRSRSCSSTTTTSCLTVPNTFSQISFAEIDQAWDMGCVAIGATIYFGSDDSNRQIQEVMQAFAHAHDLGMATILWCYLRNSAFKVGGVDHHSSADLTGQANHSRRDHRRGHREAEAAPPERRLPRHEHGRLLLRQVRRPHLQRARQRPPHRPDPLPGRQWLHGTGGP